MPKVDLKLYSTDAGDGKKITTSVSYVNPNASNTVLKSFAQQLNALTTNTYGAADRVETVNVDTEERGKQFRNIQITNSGNSFTITFVKTATEASFTPAAFYDNTAINITQTDSGDPTVGMFTGTVSSTGGWLYVGINEKTDFYSAFISSRIS